MGLDKKPTPPPKTLRGDQSQEQSASSLQDEPEMEADRTGGGAASHLERESSQTPKMETAVEEEPAPVESKVKDAYEEDFEADDEGPVEEATLQEEKPPSSLGKTEKQDQKADGSEAEDEEFDEDKTSCSGSSVSGSDEAETDGETTKHSEEDEKEDKAEENDQTEAAASASEKDTWKSEETAASRAQAASVNNSDMLDSAGDSTGLEISDTSVLTGNENELSNDPSENKNVEHAGDEIKNEDEQERAKSVQEKLAEAILKESQCSSEPELSDTSTEEEEGPADKANKKENEEQLMTPAEAMNHEESVTNEVVEEQIKFTEAEEEKDMELDYCDNTQEERPSEVGEEEKAADDESRTEGDKSEEPGEEQPPVDGENVAQDDKIEDPFEGSESADVEAPHNDEDKVEKDAAEPDTQQDETGPRAKSGDTDESPGLEPNEEADKATVPDIAEAEAAATSETMETKAESSEEQEALSCEEAPEPGTEKMQTDSEEAQITAENSSRLPEECGDSTAEKTADVHVETAKSHSSNEETEVETKQQVAGAEEGEDGGQQENCRMGEESVEVNEAPEKHSLTNSEEITEAENKAEENHDDTKADASIEQNKNPTEGTECQDIPDENKDEISDTEKDDEGEGVEGEINLGGPEAKVDDKGQAGEEESETKVLQEKEDEAEISENVENDRIKESKTEEESEDTSKNSVAEEIETSEITEEPEKSQDADLDTQKVKMSSENTAESENVSENKEADGTETHEPTPDVTYSETEKTEAERESERGEVDAENGEGSFAAECEPREDEEKALSADEKRQAEEPDEEFESAEVNEVAGDNVEKQEDSLTDPAPETGITESDAKEGDGSMVKHDEAVNRDSEPDVQDEKNGIEEEEAVKDDNEESNLTPNNIEGDDGEVSPLGEIPSAPTAAADVEETANQEDEGKPESVTEKPLETVENGEDAEEASKASEEGASVLLKPPAQNTEAEDAVGEGIPEVLARDNGADMVTNWIQMHQTSKFFETFVEPLEDLRNEVPNAQVSHLKAEEMESADLLRPESPTKMGRTSRDGETEESRDETQESRGEADQCENDSAEGAPQGSEETSKKSLEINKETDQHDSRGSHEDDKESGEGNTAFTTEVEAFSGSLKAGSDFENRSSENVNSDEGLILKQAATDLSSKPEPSNSLNEQKDTDDTWDNISRDERQITQVTNFTTSHSADGSQEESHDEEAQTKMPEQSFSGETRDMQLIEDIKHTLSKEHLSTFSLFGHTSYPLLTTSGSDGGQ